MPATAIEKISPAEYLEVERKSDIKNEYIEGILLPMSGASWIHTLICSNLIRIIGNFLERQDVTVHGSDLRIAGEGGDKYFYPDVVVIKDDPKFTDEVFDTITNPFLIIEVLSESTESYDRQSPPLRRPGERRQVSGIPFHRKFTGICIGIAG